MNLISAIQGFGTWLSNNFDTDQSDEVSTEQLLEMQYEQQKTLLIVIGLVMVFAGWFVYAENL